MAERHGDFLRLAARDLHRHPSWLKAAGGDDEDLLPQRHIAHHELSAGVRRRLPAADGNDGARNRHAVIGSHEALNDGQSLRRRSCASDGSRPGRGGGAAWQRGYRSKCACLGRLARARCRRAVRAGDPAGHGQPRRRAGLSARRGAGDDGRLLRRRDCPPLPWRGRLECWRPTFGFFWRRTRVAGLMSISRTIGAG